MYKLSFLPWHQRFSEHFLQRLNRGHAWLLHGPEGSGKVHFAHVVTASLLCETPSEQRVLLTEPCGKCQACHWFINEAHPDFFRIHPEGYDFSIANWLMPYETIHESIGSTDKAADPGSTTTSDGVSTSKASQDIKVDQIRQLEKSLQLSRHRQTPRIILIFPAERMNMVAANALLKLLEEPPANTLILLIVNYPDQMPATLLSRCIKAALPQPDHASATQWLMAQDTGSELSPEKAQACLAASGGAPIVAWNAHQQDEVNPLLSLLEYLHKIAEGELSASRTELATALQVHAPSLWLDALQRWLVDVSLSVAKQPSRYIFSGNISRADDLHAKQSSTNNLASNLSSQQKHRDKGIYARLNDPAYTQQLQTDFWYFYRWLNTQQKVAHHPLNPKLFALEGAYRLQQILQG